MNICGLPYASYVIPLLTKFLRTSFFSSLFLCTHDLSLDDNSTCASTVFFCRLTLFDRFCSSLFRPCCCYFLSSTYGYSHLFIFCWVHAIPGQLGRFQKVKSNFYLGTLPISSSMRSVFYLCWRAEPVVAMPTTRALKCSAILSALPNEDISLSSV